MPVIAQTYTTDQRSKAIHIVYDDSGSMISSNNVYHDRWGQAKYAMEVFAAMLQERDTMRVYYMSDFDATAGGRINANPRIEINGAEPVGERVAGIHNTVTRAANTPFDPVVKAYNDLRIENVDEKWLVILTDGDFNILNGISTSNIDVDDRLSQYARESDISIILLAIGDDADLERLLSRLNPNQSIGYYVDHARNSNDILGKLTSICNRIFNRNLLPLGEVRREFKFDLPMLELLVFAQGENVKINGIRGSGSYSPSGTVNVRYSEVAATNWANDRNVIISTNLTGVIASFQNIPKGSYSLDISGGQTVEIYYKPSVNVDIRLYRRRKQVRPQEITEGKYQIRFGIVDENGRFFESSLLGSVEYEATLHNDGQTINIKSGNTIKINEGNFTVYVQAHFLGINTAENSITGNVIPPPTFKEIVLDIIKEFWYIFCLLLALLLYWLLWGQKKRFPKKHMTRRPIIQEEIEGNVVTKNGRFNIDTKTIWLPRCAEKGTIKAVPTEKTLPKLKVRAKGRNIMELYNADAFKPEKLHGVEVRINGIPMEGIGNSMDISCMSTIEVTYPGRDGSPNETYTCFLEKGKR
jgi:hypothetical protein